MIILTWWSGNLRARRFPSHGDVTLGRLTRPQVSTATTLTCRGTARHGGDEVTYTATAPVS
ncbi:hypothetical protein ACWCYL_44010 [Streptomyces sp. 900105755]|uniref:hypothetical protein n=1 Tax=Streptomyces sp. 900105755 TaxID=3154389 RepID=UPI0033272825